MTQTSRLLLTPVVELWVLKYLTRWKFTRGFVFDGNFSAEQLKMKRPEDDVHLTDGTGFLTAEARYQEHLKVAIEIKEVRSYFF